MRIALVAPPFIPVPPTDYGGTELFVANLAEGLCHRGVDVIVYANGESTTSAELRFRYANSDWPLSSEQAGLLKEMDHTAWALRDAMDECDILHVNSAFAVTFSQFATQPMVCTLHHPQEDPLTSLYERYPEIHYVAISHHQASIHPSIRSRTIHHGIDVSLYHSSAQRQPYLVFLGRIAPVKGAHVAIEIAKKVGIPLKMAGEVQPMYQDYFEQEIQPHLDGRFIEYLGPADLQMKNELLGNSIGMLFPIQWNEPFGLVLVEAMACGAPVFALDGGSVPEIVCENVSGAIRNTADELVDAIHDTTFDPQRVRGWVDKHFSYQAMADCYLEYYSEILGLPADDLEPLTTEVA